MRPDEREINDELRGHLALSIKERIERGEDPAAARRAALDELGYIADVRDSIRRVWYSRWFDAAAALGREMRIGLRSLLRTKGLAVTVVVTLALGIGANAAIFSVVRGVLLRPLVNRGEDRLVYIRQSAPGVSTENMTFSVPEINDLKARATTIGAFGQAGGARSSSPSRVTRRPTEKTTRTPGTGPSVPASSRRWASRWSPAASSGRTIAPAASAS
jgi:hypothetical protein